VQGEIPDANQAVAHDLKLPATLTARTLRLNTGGQFERLLELATDLVRNNALVLFAGAVDVKIKAIKAAPTQSAGRRERSNNLCWLDEC
jgi:hypothetical protein